MPGEVTNAELARRLDAFASDVHDDLGAIGNRLDKLVSRELYDAQREGDRERVRALERSIDALKTAVEQDRKGAADERRQRDIDRRADRRVVWAAAAAALAALLLELLKASGAL